MRRITQLTRKARRTLKKIEQDLTKIQRDHNLDEWWNREGIVMEDAGYGDRRGN